jgi:hypothetical protein
MACTALNLEAAQAATYPSLPQPPPTPPPPRRSAPPRHPRARYTRALDPWGNWESDDVWMAPREMQRSAYRAASTFLKVRGRAAAAWLALAARPSGHGGPLAAASCSASWQERALCGASVLGRWRAQRRRACAQQASGVGCDSSCCTVLHRNTLQSCAVALQQMWPLDSPRAGGRRLDL